MQAVAQSIINRYNITKKNVEEPLAAALNAMTHNVVGLAVARSDQQVRQVKPQDVMNIELCKPVQRQRGGAVMASEFYGIQSGNYSDASAGGTVMSRINFDAGIARPELGSQVGGGGQDPKMKKLLLQNIKKALEYYNATATKAGTTKLVKVMSILIECLGQELARSRYSLKTIIAKKRYAMFR